VTPDLHRAVEEDLSAFAPRAVNHEAEVQRILAHLANRWGLAEFRLAGGERISWLFDARSGQLLSTYPNGANRIRQVASARHQTRAN